MTYLGGPSITLVYGYYSIKFTEITGYGSSYFCAQRNVPIRDLFHKPWIRIVEHDVEMLHGMYAFKGSPVLEPDYLEQSG